MSCITTQKGINGCEPNMNNLLIMDAIKIAVMKSDNTLRTEILELLTILDSQVSTLSTQILEMDNKLDLILAKP